MIVNCLSRFDGQKEGGFDFGGKGVEIIGGEAEAVEVKGFFGGEMPFEGGIGDEVQILFGFDEVEIVF